MGQYVQQDMAISVPVMLALLRDLESDWQAATTAREKCFLTSIGASICIAICGSFWGPEVFLTDLAGFHSYSSSPPDPSLPHHVIVPLL